MLDILTVLFWALAYIFSIYAKIQDDKQKYVAFPFISGALNITWEIVSVIHSRGFWGHCIWLVLDVVIVSMNLVFLQTSKRRFAYICFLLFCLIMLTVFFESDSFNGMLISSFIIDLIMAGEYVFMIKKLPSYFRLEVGVFRTLGDLFAWLSNLRQSMLVSIIGILILLINLFYVCYCIELQNTESRRTA